MNDRLMNDLLGDGSTWAEPRADLEDAVVQAVVNAPAPADTAARASDNEHPSARDVLTGELRPG